LRVQEVARTFGLQIHVLNATTIDEIDVAFATLARDHFDALFVIPNGFFASRRVQLANLAARERIPATHGFREYVAAGGLMSYGTSVEDSYRQLGTYTGKILNGAKPADLPVLCTILSIAAHHNDCAVRCWRGRGCGRAGHGRTHERSDRPADHH
jgi:putative ABC transport system substrate-binding protein